jgi:hypothetical protein
MHPEGRANAMLARGTQNQQLPCTRTVRIEFHVADDRLLVLSSKLLTKSCSKRDFNHWRKKLMIQLGC